MHKQKIVNEIGGKAHLPRYLRSFSFLWSLRSFVPHEYVRNSTHIFARMYDAMVNHEREFESGNKFLVTMYLL